MGWLENKELKSKTILHLHNFNPKNEFWRVKNNDRTEKVKVGEHISSDEGAKEDITVTLKTLVKATGKFSDDKKLGDGYLGAVYKVAN